jgi:hypothetical protein
VVAVVFGLLAWEYLCLEDDFRTIRFQRSHFVGVPSHESLARPVILDQLAALNETAHYDIAPGMPPDQLAQLGIVARRFHLLATKIDYAKALALNGDRAGAEAQLVMIRSIYHPTVFRLIDIQWREWLESEQFSPLE